MIHPTLQPLGNAENGDEANAPAVVLLTGGDRLSLDSVAFSLLDGRPDAGLVSYGVMMRLRRDCPLCADVCRRSGGEGLVGHRTDYTRDLVAAASL